MSEKLNYALSEKFSYKRRRRLGSFCVRHNIERPIVPKNNDALAHVYLFASAEHLQDVEKQLYAEFITDISERSKEEHFYGIFNFEFNGQDLVSDTGLSLRQILETGLAAAHADGIEYGVKRAEVLFDQLRQLIDWATSDDNGQIAFFSLCPEEQELPSQQAKALNFKQDRMMSSNWLFEKDSNSRIVMHAFSLDNHTLIRHQALLESPDVSTTTLAELGTARHYSYSDGSEAVEQIRAKFDEPNGTYFGKYSTDRLSANQLVANKPETFDFYREAVLATAEALGCGRVTRRYKALTAKLKSGFAGYDAPISCLNKRLFSVLSPDEAAETMEYIRRQAIPHFIFGKIQGNISIVESGAIAFSRQLTYDSACPTTSSTMQEQQRIDQSRLEIIFFGRPPVRERFFESKFCPCCLPRPITGQSVKAWSGEGFIGCEDCGHIVEICGTVYRQGDARRRKDKIKKTCAKK